MSYEFAGRAIDILSVGMVILAIGIVSARHMGLALTLFAAQSLLLAAAGLHAGLAARPRSPARPQRAGGQGRRMLARSSAQAPEVFRVERPENDVHPLGVDERDEHRQQEVQEHAQLDDKRHPVQCG